MFIEKLKESLIKLGFYTNKKILLGVSGGPDSMAMLHAFGTLGIELYVAYFDHKLRDDSSEDIKKIEALKKDFKMTVFYSSGDVRSYAETEKLSLETAARHLRYSFLFQVADQMMAEAVAVAHNSNDQAETILMHLLRGSGLRGLSGMQAYLLGQWHPTIPLIRPMLSFWRTEIENYCQLNSIGTVHDVSNVDQVYLRNRVRQELIPQLETYNPSFQSALLKLGETASVDMEFVEGVFAAAWQESQPVIQVGSVSFLRSVFVSQAVAIQRRFLEHAFSLLRPGNPNFSHAHRLKCLEWISEAKNFVETEIVAGVHLILESERIIFFDPPYQRMIDTPQTEGLKIKVEFNQTTELGNGWFIIVDKLQNHEFSMEIIANNDQAFVEYFDLDSAGEELYVRSVATGDTFTPLGMAGKSMKLSDYFINQKIPKQARNSIPLLCHREDIIWVVGHRSSENSKVTKQSRNVFRISVIKDEKKIYTD